MVTTSSHLELLINVLATAAKENDVGSLYKSIREDPKILNEILIQDTPFADTLLHVAASCGNTLFVAEMMSIMPSLSKKLNCDGLTPLHLALQNGHIETARRMITLDGGLIRFPGRGRMTPMHYLVSISGEDVDKLELLIDFLWASPKAVGDVTIECKTPLHVAVDSKHLKAFEVLFGWVKRTEQLNVLRMKDSLGNNVLHLAVITNQPKVVERVAHFPSLRTQTNQNVCTPFDIAIALEEQDGIERVGNDQVKKNLNRYGNIRGSTLSKIKKDRLEFFRTEETVSQILVRYFVKINKCMSMDLRNVVLVVAVLVATATFQAALQPPGGFTQATPKVALNKSETNNHVVIGRKLPTLFMFLNTLAFIATVGVMLFALPVQFYSFCVHVALVFMTISYLIAIYLISNQLHWVTLTTILFSFVAFVGTCVVRAIIFFFEWECTLPRIQTVMYAILPESLLGAIGGAEFHQLRLQMETVLCSPSLNNPQT